MQNDESDHLGVARCSGNNCHGAVERPKGSNVAQNEYLIWAGETDKGTDKHRQAYEVLKKERAVQIAHNLGLPDAVSGAWRRTLASHPSTATTGTRFP